MIFYNRHVRNEVRREFKEGDLVQFKNFNGDRNWQPGQIVSVRNPDRSYTLQNKFGNLVNRNRRMMLHDRASKEMKYDIDLPENQVATPSTVTKPTVPNPAFVPVSHQPLRRSQRSTRKPEFYGNPVAH